MSIYSGISSFNDLGQFFRTFLEKKSVLSEDFNSLENKFLQSIQKAESENPWFTRENIFLALEQWAKVLTTTDLENWTKQYKYTENPKRVGVIMAGNIPLVGFHDLLSVLLSGHQLIVKTSSKDDALIDFILDFLMNSNEKFNSSIQKTERLKDFDAVIATGSNNTARYFDYYFRKVPSIIRKNRTSVAVLTGEESPEDLRNLGKDLFSYFGLGCRNVTKIYLPKNFNTDLLFESFYDWKSVIHHTKYANNYEYNRAVYLLSKEAFLDNNFVILKESKELHSPVGVVYFEFYNNSNELKNELHNLQEEIQCVVAQTQNEFSDSVKFGQTQNPSLNDYADGVDVMQFLENL
ncbi:MAG: acyl-CoA reductase [Weeksellaceae bacterium]|jgi:hypothetical protein|nr:acyl-CoA reductase [Weeksellaceae bacterium]